MPSQLQQLRQQQNKGFEPFQPQHKGYLIKVNGSVKVANRAGYVWIKDGLGSVRQVFNPKVADTANLPVRLAPVRAQSDDLMVIDVDWQNLKESKLYDGSPYLKNHAADHEWRGGFPGPDALTVYPQAWAELRTSPFSGLQVYVSGWFHFRNNAPALFPGGLYDLSGHQPASGSALVVGVYFDTTAGDIDFVTGSTIADVETVLPPLPSRPAAAIMSAYVRLDGDQTEITWRDIFNARQLLNDRGMDISDNNTPYRRNFLLMGA